jgi:hypothetical protein
MPGHVSSLSMCRDSRQLVLVVVAQACVDLVSFEWLSGLEVHDLDCSTKSPYVCERP